MNGENYKIVNSKWILEGPIYIEIAKRRLIWVAMPGVSKDL